MGLRPKGLKAKSNIFGKVFQKEDSTEVQESKESMAIDPETKLYFHCSVQIMTLLRGQPEADTYCTSRSKFIVNNGIILPS